MSSSIVTDSTHLDAAIVSNIWLCINYVNWASISDSRHLDVYLHVSLWSVGVYVFVCTTIYNFTSFIHMNSCF
jgi:hypothetical protein